MVPSKSKSDKNVVDSDTIVFQTQKVFFFMRNAQVTFAEKKQIKINNLNETKTKI